MNEANLFIQAYSSVSNTVEPTQARKLNALITLQLCENHLQLGMYFTKTVTKTNSITYNKINNNCKKNEL